MQLRGLSAAALCAAVVLGGCGRSSEPLRRCTAVPRWDQLVPSRSADARRDVPKSLVAEWCVRRAAYLMARAPEDAGVVKNAAVATCWDDIADAMRDVPRVSTGRIPT